LAHPQATQRQAPSVSPWLCEMLSIVPASRQHTMSLSQASTAVVLLLLLVAPASSERIRAKIGREMELERELCDLSRFGDRYQNEFRVAGDKRGCVFTAEDTHHNNAQVEIKFSRKAKDLKRWQKICKHSKTIQKEACLAAPDELKLVEHYFPACLEIGSEDEAFYMVRHSATGRPLKAASLKAGARKAVWAQMVGGVAALHSVGLCASDVSAYQTVLLQSMLATRVVFDDTGDLVPLSSGCGGDADFLAQQAALLAECPQAVETHEALSACLTDRWCSKSEPCDFVQVVQDALGKTTDSTSRVLKLYRSAFVQNHQGDLESLFPASCDGDDYTTVASTTAAVTTAEAVTTEPPTTVTSTSSTQTSSTETTSSTAAAAKTAQATTEAPAGTTTKSSAAGLRPGGGGLLLGLLPLLLLARGAQ